MRRNQHSQHPKKRQKITRKPESKKEAVRKFKARKRRKSSMIGNNEVDE